MELYNITQIIIVTTEKSPHLGADEAMLEVVISCASRLNEVISGFNILLREHRVFKYLLNLNFNNILT